MLVKTLGLSAGERISLYRHEDEEKSFVLLGRYSSQPEYAKRSSRSYPDDQGALGLAWKDPAAGENLVEDLPDPETEKDLYVQIHEREYKMPAETVAKLTMPARSLMAFVLEDKKEYNTRVWLMVLESVKPKMPSKQKIRDFVKGEGGTRVAEFLDGLRPFEPSRSLARKEGF